MTFIQSILVLLLANPCGGKETTDTAEFDRDGDGYTADDGDCDDFDATVYPGATEVCDGVDNACQGSLMTGESDADGDGYVSCLSSQTLATGDCDDHDPTINPDAEEVCDGLDNDCDGVIDDCE